MSNKGKFRSFFVRLKFSSQMAASGLTANIMRTFLTLLGIAIGVAAVVSLMGIGEGARQAVVRQFESLGQNVIVIKSNNPIITFEPNESEELIDRVEGLEYATPVVNTNAKIRWRRTSGELDILGVNEDFPIIRDHEVVSGNFFTSLHVKQRSPVVVLGYNVGASLMNGRNPVGQTIIIEGITYRIIGVLGEKGKEQAENIDNKIVIPYSTALKIAEKRTVNEIWGKSNSPESASLAIVQLGRIYKRQLGLENGFTGTTQDSSTDGEMDGDNINVDPEKPMPEPEPENPVENLLNSGEDILTITSLNQLVEEADQANRIMTLLLGGIAAVSLLVGGIGIMNIMLVAVSERTSEIGVRRALGAKQNDLLIQFLLEALYVSVLGCICGIILGIWITQFSASYGLDAVVNMKSIKISVAVALSSGLLFGVYPAVSASSMPPVEALRRQ